MATLKFDGKSYTVHHAVKGADYVHGYDANGLIIVSIDGISNFSVVTYDGTYMSPADCTDEACNILMYVGGTFRKRDGTVVTPYTLPTANGSTLGGVKLSDATNSTSAVSGGLAATPKAVKAAYDVAAAANDVAAAAMPKGGGLFTGVVTLASQSYTGGCGRNILVQNNGGTANVSTQYIIMQRK